jgi:hypothetical protein
MVKEKKRKHKEKYSGDVLYVLIFKLDLRTFVAGKFPDDGTVLPKHVGVGTW